MKSSKLLSLVLVFVLSPLVATAANVTLQLGTAPTKFHPVFTDNSASLTSASASNLLVSFKATSDGTASTTLGTNTTVGPVRDSNVSASSYNVYVNGVMAPIGTITVNTTTGALTFIPN